MTIHIILHWKWWELNLGPSVGNTKALPLRIGGSLFSPIPGVRQLIRLRQSSLIRLAVTAQNLRTFRLGKPGTEPGTLRVCQAGALPLSHHSSSCRRSLRSSFVVVRTPASCSSYEKLTLWSPSPRKTPLLLVAPSLPDISY